MLERLTGVLLFVGYWGGTVFLKVSSFIFGDASILHFRSEVVR